MHGWKCNCFTVAGSCRLIIPTSCVVCTFIILSNNPYTTPSCCDQKGYVLAAAASLRSSTNASPSPLCWKYSAIAYLAFVCTSKAASAVCSGHTAYIMTIYIGIDIAIIMLLPAPIILPRCSLSLATALLEAGILHLVKAWLNIWVCRTWGRSSKVDSVGQRACVLGAGKTRCKQTMAAPRMQSSGKSAHNAIHWRLAGMVGYLLSLHDGYANMFCIVDKSSYM